MNSDLTSDDSLGRPLWSPAALWPDGFTPRTGGPWPLIKFLLVESRAAGGPQDATASVPAPTTQDTTPPPDGTYPATIRYSRAEGSEKVRIEFRVEWKPGTVYRYGGVVDHARATNWLTALRACAGLQDDDGDSALDGCRTLITGKQRDQNGRLIWVPTAFGKLEEPPGPPEQLAQAKRRWQHGIVTLPELVAESQAESGMPFVVDSLIAEASVNILVGDSGLGKSPLAYQLGMSVATGRPFLDNATKQGRVLVVDLENGRSDIVDLCGRLARHLGLTGLPADLVLWSYGTSSYTELDLESWVKEVKPSLVIIDSLRAYSPAAEAENRNAAALWNSLRKIAKSGKTAFLVIHHIKKPREDSVPALEDTPVMTWLLQACGARGLVNQADGRMGVDTARSVEAVLDELNDKTSPDREPALIVKGFARLRGEFGPSFLTRVFDDAGEVLGYRPMAGVDLLPSVQRQAYSRLPIEFTLKVAMQVYGKGAQATLDFLQKCMRVGVLRKVGHGRSARYHKVAIDATGGVSGA